MQSTNSAIQYITQKIASWQNRSPFILLFLAGIVGVFTGLLGSLFQIGLNLILNWHKNFSQHPVTSSSYFNYFLIFTIAAVMGAFSYYLVKKFAPESSGSGIPEVEGALLDERPVRWWRVLPVKFFGGLAALGSGMILGREGPTVQMGANLGKMTSDAFKLKDKESQHTLIATGAGAGITTAFNAPLGGILFIIEEMHDEFSYTKTSVKAIFVGCITACITYQFIMSSASILTLPTPNNVPLNSLWLFIILGLFLGAIGSLSNFLILRTRSYLQAFYKKNKFNFIVTGAVLAGSFGLLLSVASALSGDGFDVIPKVTEGFYAFYPLLLIFIFRFFATVLCFGSGAPGGIFSPTMALGAILGVLFGLIIQQLLPQYDIHLSSYAILAMAGLFAATIRAPLTGIVIIMEMTNGYMLILPLLLTCVSATFIAQTLGSLPLYSAILQSTLKNNN
ncbi:H(+)/Cl(-) exchange transporter ClcA [Flavobacterium agricola]|uniref:H(+)/Cl(-) exchange transporter ClcA n=1 Tax=Flavobacterium agricola TaxID=2870839 RepID=A0ABY6M1P0_9FLAO|nr:H(+)/Cl(-) exchange transporter ClcA [Flavobacterium agricola]UYW02482.1 H(+)/Cl(-) exchange transporter ClcA [Flavobacterium agricola]